MSISLIGRGLTALILASMNPTAAQDIFGVGSSVPPSSGAPLIEAEFCPQDRIAGKLTLRDAVERALCVHPQAKQVWAGIKAQADALGAAEGAFLPTVTISGQDISDHADTIVPGNGYLNSHFDEANYTVSASLSWLLFDFGGREAAIENAKELLAGAIANHADVLQTIFVTTSKDYLAALASRAVLDTAVVTERNAKESLDVAGKRTDRGIAPISDKLQAEAAYLQAKVNSQKAEGDLHTAVGTLAADMGISPDVEIELPSIEQTEMPGSDFDLKVSQMIADALKRHPKILYAEAQLRAAEANVDQTRAGGLPTVSLIAKSSRDNRGVAAAQGLPLNPATTLDNYVGVEVSFPIFEGFTRHYKTRQANAQREAQANALEDVRRQVSLAVWTGYHALQTATRNVSNTDKLLEIAQQSYTVAERRYESGAGPILELLTSQLTLANARRQRIQALTDWRASRIDMTARLGAVQLEDSSLDQ